MFERFTDRARRIVTLATECAVELGDLELRPNHLLAGMLREGESIAALALRDCGIEYDPTAAEGKTRSAGSPAFTPATKKALEMALREALQLGHNYIGAEHLLLGVLREGSLDDDLLAYDTDANEIRRAVIARLGGTIRTWDHPKRPEREASVTSVEDYIRQLVEQAARLQSDYLRLAAEGVEALAGLIYQAWRNGAGHVCEEEDGSPCEHCLDNARVAASIVIAGRNAA